MIRPPVTVAATLGVILAGGLSSRMGQEKSLLTLRGRRLLDHAIDRLQSQVDYIIINANGDPARFGAVSRPIVADTVSDRPGPLAGLLAAIDWAHTAMPDVSHVASVPVDTPFFPTDLVERLRAGIEGSDGAQLAFARTFDGQQPVFALVSTSLRQALARDLQLGGARRVADWLRTRSHVEVMFDNPDAFFNLNTPEDLVRADAILSARG